MLEVNNFAVCYSYYQECIKAPLYTLAIINRAFLLSCACHVTHVCVQAAACKLDRAKGVQGGNGKLW